MRWINLIFPLLLQKFLKSTVFFLIQVADLKVTNALRLLFVVNFFPRNVLLSET